MPSISTKRLPAARAINGGVPPTPFDVALVAGLAPDGGLYVPEAIPQVDLSTPRATLAETADAGAFLLACLGPEDVRVVRKKGA